jgi:hypothetical protein
MLIIAAAALALAVVWVVNRPSASTPKVSPTAYGTASSEVLLVAGLSTRTGANMTSRQVTITFDIDNTGRVPADIAKIDVASRPGMQLLSVTPTKALVAVGKDVTVALTYRITNCNEAMSATATGPVPVLVNIATGTVTRMVEPHAETPNGHWELFAASAICNGPTLTQS